MSRVAISNDVPVSSLVAMDITDPVGSFLPYFVTERNLSLAWYRASSASLSPGVKALAPLVVTVTGFEKGEPNETLPVRSAIDVALSAYATEQNAKSKSPKERDPLTCRVVANTIFPRSLWTPGVSRHSLYARYRAMIPRLKRRGSPRGLYFERLINYGRGPEGGNQLEHIIASYGAGVRRASAFQATICDPERDSTRQPLLGFPCLQQIAVRPDGQMLSITGFYGTQYLFERAYGNYLGLCWLGQFLAHEMGLTLTRMTCVTSYAPFSADTRQRVRQLNHNVASLLQDEIGPAQNV